VCCLPAVVPCASTARVCGAGTGGAAGYAEAIPFNPAHEPAFFAGLLLQLPFGFLAYLLGRALLRLGAKLARILSGARGRVVTRRPATGLRPVRTIPARIPILALGHSVRGPPGVSLSF
jgi:hypothetical protein